jgi:lipopolysaccharide biosynthesis regulator YciM
VSTISQDPDPVKLSVATNPAALAQREKEIMNLPFVRHFPSANDLGLALLAAEHTLKANPKSIFAHILVGELKEAQGDFHGALESYAAAENEFHRQYQPSCEPPVYFILKSAEMRKKMNANP